MTSSEIFIKNCQEKNVGQYNVDQFSKDPQGLWDSQEDPSSMLDLLSKFSGEIDSTSRKATSKCLIETVKPCMRNIPNGENRPLRLMAVLEKYCEGTATIEEVKKARDTLSDVLDYASLAVWYCASFAIENVHYYASNVASYAAFSEENKEAENQYNKNSCKTIRKHFPIIPGLAEEKKEISLKRLSTFELSLEGQTFTLTTEKLLALKKLIEDLMK